jgi:hypothetical protein
MAKFRSYNKASHFNRCGVEEQQAYFMACIDPYLEARIVPMVRPATPVLSDADVSCMSLVKNEFLLRYPLFARRLDFFQLKFPKGELPSDSAQKLTKFGDEAELDGMSRGDLYVMRYLTAFEEEGLRTLFLREKDPTKAKLDAIITQYEIGQTNRRRMTEAATGANSTAQGNRQNLQRQSNERRSRPQSRPYIVHDHKKRDKLRASKLCFRCTEMLGSGHDPKNCKAKDRTCSSCGKLGHLERACFGAPTRRGQEAKRRPISSARMARTPRAPETDTSSESSGDFYGMPRQGTTTAGTIRAVRGY